MKDKPNADDMKRAAEWRAVHWRYVEALLKDTLNCYAPTGSDCTRPALWKPANWAWFETQTQKAE